MSSPREGRQRKYARDTIGCAVWVRSGAYCGDRCREQPMKKKHLVVISALGLIGAAGGFFRYWVLMSVLIATSGAFAGERVNIDVWVSLTIGCLGVAVLVGAGIACAASKRKKCPTER